MMIMSTQEWSQIEKLNKQIPNINKKIVFFLNIICVCGELYSTIIGNCLVRIDGLEFFPRANVYPEIGCDIESVIHSVLIYWGQVTYICIWTNCNDF